MEQNVIRFRVQSLFRQEPKRVSSRLSRPPFRLVHALIKVRVRHLLSVSGEGAYDPACPESNACPKSKG